MASGGGLVQCTFEEFEFATPLLQVIVTALDRVAGFVTEAKEPFLLKLAKDNREMAVRLRHRFSEVPSKPLQAVIRTAAKLHLGRLDRFWKPALALARPTLEQSALLLDSKGPDTQGSLTRNEGSFLRIDVVTPTVWEKLLSQAASNIGKVMPPQGLPNLWLGLGQDKKLKADLVVALPAVHPATSGESLIFDAKYKECPPAGYAPDRNDLFQMFVYSHQHRPPGLFRHLVLAFVAPHSKDVGKPYFREGSDEPADAARKRLHIEGLPWPSRMELEDMGRTGQNTYQALDVALKALVKHWEAASA